jgi:ankyrin repeat protein
MDALLAAARAIAKREASARRLCRGLAREAFGAGATRADPQTYFLDDIRHYVYAGDTLLHVAAAAFDAKLARALVEEGADLRARNRRGAEPLHYACDANTWSPRAQGETVAYLLSAGADPNALDKSGVAPLHRAVRTRATSAVRALLEAGADPRLKNKSGSTPLDLARMTTGRGGTGSPEMKKEQAAIERLLG